MGLKGLVLKWFKSYPTDRYFSVRIGSSASSAAPVETGLPQGSILSPSLFSLYASFRLDYKKAWYLFPFLCRWYADLL